MGVDFFPCCRFFYQYLFAVQFLNEHSESTVSSSQPLQVEGELVNIFSHGRYCSYYYKLVNTVIIINLLITVIYKFALGHNHYVYNTVCHIVLKVFSNKVHKIASRINAFNQ